MINKIKYFVLLIVLVAVGCANVPNQYVEISKSQPYATIQCYSDATIARKQLFMVNKVDGRILNVSQKWSLNSEFRISPGFHKVKADIRFVNYKFNGAEGTQAETDMTLQFNAKAGHHYVLQGSRNNNRVYGWIKDKVNGQIVSNKDFKEVLPLGSDLVKVPEMSR